MYNLLPSYLIEFIITLYEALREKVELLGIFQGILLKLHILKLIFHHKNIIFFGLDFFPDKVLLRSVQK